MTNPSINTLVMTEMDNTILSVARAALRYAALRRLTPKQFTALHAAALTGPQSFDALVDCLVIDMHTDKFQHAEAT